MWKVVFSVVGVSLVAFFAVGIIASTQEFSGIFLKNYFIIAIIWSLASSSLLSWFVRLLGGGTKDAVATFLAMLGIWLVVIQIGQVRVGDQLHPGQSG